MRCIVVKWDSRSERDWRIFLNSEVAFTVLVDGESFLGTARSIRGYSENEDVGLGDSRSHRRPSRTGRRVLVLGGIA